MDDQLMINWYIVDDGYDWHGYLNHRLCLRISTSPFDKSMYSYRLYALVYEEYYHAEFMSSHSTLENAKRAAKEAIRDATSFYAVESLMKLARERNKKPAKQPERTVIKIEEVECDGNLN